MPSPTFEHFLAQLHAQGRDKAEGFDHSHFDGLLPDERPQVAAMLRDAAVHGDSTAINGLVYFDRATAPDALRAVLAQLPPNSPDRPRVLSALWHLAPDPQLQAVLVQELLRAVDGTPTIQRTLVINQLRQTAPNPSLVRPLRDYVHREGDGENRMEGAKLALYWAGVAPSLAAAFQEHRALMIALESGHFLARRRALGDFDRLLGAG